jgi:hypothetical protein
VTALVVAHLHGRPPPEAFSRTRFGVVHLWSIDSPQFRLPPAFALHFQDEYLYPPVPLWPPDDQMQNYHKMSIYLKNQDYRLRNEIERTGVYIGNDGPIKALGKKASGGQSSLISFSAFRTS